MRAKPFHLESSPTVKDVDAVPFASEFVTLTKHEHIELVRQAHCFKSLHERAVARAVWREDRYQRVLRQMKEQGELPEAALQAQLQEAQARESGICSSDCLAAKVSATRVTNCRAEPAISLHSVGIGVARRAMAA